MRTELCNVIANHLIDYAEVDWDATLTTLESQARAEWPGVEVPGDDYPKSWTRFENVTLSEPEIAYVMDEVRANTKGIE